MGGRATFPGSSYYLTPGDRANYEEHIGKRFISTNPLPYLEQGGRDLMQQTDIVATQGITIKPMKGLKIRAEFSQIILISIMRIKEQKLVLSRQAIELILLILSMILDFQGLITSKTGMIKGSIMYSMHMQTIPLSQKILITISRRLLDLTKKKVIDII